VWRYSARHCLAVGGLASEWGGFTYQMSGAVGPGFPLIGIVSSLIGSERASREYERQRVHVVCAGELIARRRSCATARCRRIYAIASSPNL
jgi:hypothetical protein